MSNEYRIEKDRRPVIITTIGGERIAGDMFVQSYARHRHGAEAPQDVLNDHEPFFPLAVGGDDTLLIAKDRVREVEIAEAATDEDDVRGAGARQAMIEISLAGGETRTGAVFLEVPFDRPRLLDYLNRLTDRFLVLSEGEGVRLVNRLTIERARSLD